MKFPKFAAALGLSASLLAAGAPASAQTELVMSSWLPPQHPIVVNAMVPWAEEVAVATEGRVTVRVLASPLGPPPAHYDLAVDGVADVTYGLHSFTRDDRFLRSRIGQFSFIGDDAVSASVAFWTVYTEMLEAEAEHEGVQLLGLFVHGPGLVHTGDQRLSAVSDFDGLRLRTPGGYIADLMTRLGATVVFMGPGEVYEKLSRGVIDGVTFTYEALTAFNLTGDIRYTMRVPGGVYNTTWFLVVNEERWAEISPEDQAAILAISGEAFAIRVGEAWNAADVASFSELETAGVDIYDASPEILEAIVGHAAELEAEWIAAVDAAGSDGAAALEAIRTLSGVAE